MGGGAVSERRVAETRQCVRGLDRVKLGQACEVRRGGEAGRLADCFATLEPDRADAVRGAYLNGQSYVELAERHGVPLNTMRTWLRRSLLKLKECLDT